MSRMSTYALIFVFIFSLAFAGNITATFRDMLSNNGVSDVNVYLYDTENVLVANVSSPSNGSVFITNLNGSYVIRTVRSGYVNSYFTVDVDASQDVSADYFLVPLATLNLYVRDNASSPVDNGVVKVLQNGNTVVAEVRGASGTVKVSPGDYDVIFSAPYYETQSYHVSLSPGASQDVYSSLRPTTLNTLPSVVSVEVLISNSSVDPGSEVNVTAIAHYNDGHSEDVTSVAVWDIDNAGAIYDSRIIATSYGTHHISATYDGKKGDQSLTVGFGKAYALDLTASSYSTYTSYSVSLNSYLVDKYQNRMSTQDVTYSTTCGSVVGSVFTSTVPCTAVVTAVYNKDNSLNDSVTITVSQHTSSSHSSSSSSGSYHSGTSAPQNSTSQATPSSQTTSSEPKTNESQTSVNEKQSIRFVFPPSVYVGDVLEVRVLDQKSDPVDGAVIIIERPDGTSVSLVTDAEGRISFTVFLPGDYKFYSRNYNVEGDMTINAKQVPVIVKPQVESKPSHGEHNVYNNSDENVQQRSFIDTIVAAFTGDISPADAIRATLPLWLIVGAVLFAAAIFFVVYTFLVGKIVSKDLPREDEQQQQQVVVQTTSSHDGTPENVKSKTVSESALVAGKVRSSEKVDDKSKVDSEISQLERELEEKMQRLRELKRMRGGS